MLFGRTWMPEQSVADDGEDTWDQRYTLDLWLPHPTDSTLMRLTSMWSSVSIGGVNEDLYVILVKGGLEEAFENASAFLAGDDCKNDRDAEYTRE
jgi:hypothetical protein